MECSFFGPTRGNQKDCHFNISMLLDLGEKFCLTLADLVDKDQSKVNQAMKDIKKLSKRSNQIPLSSQGDNEDSKNQTSTQPIILHEKTPSNIRIDHPILERPSKQSDYNQIDLRQSQAQASISQKENQKGGGSNLRNKLQGMASPSDTIKATRKNSNSVTAYPLANYYSYNSTTNQTSVAKPDFTMISSKPGINHGVIVLGLGLGQGV